jgi:hypothetical protein
MCLELIIFAKNNKESMIFWLELSKIWSYKNLWYAVLYIVIFMYIYQ